MSVRLLAVAPHRFTRFDEIAAFCSRLAEVEPLARSVAQLYWGNTSPEFLPQGWGRGPGVKSPEEAWVNRSRVTFRGPADTALTFAGHCLIAMTVAKWYFARSRPALLDAGLALFREMAAMVAAPQFIVYHDAGGLTYEWAEEAKSFADIETAIAGHGARCVASATRLLLAPSEPQNAHLLPDLYYRESTKDAP